MAFTLSLEPAHEKALGHFCVDTDKTKKEVVTAALLKHLPPKYLQAESEADKTQEF